MNPTIGAVSLSFIFKSFLCEDIRSGAEAKGQKKGAKCNSAPECFYKTVLLSPLLSFCLK